MDSNFITLKLTILKIYKHEHKISSFYKVWELKRDILIIANKMKIKLSECEIFIDNFHLNKIYEEFTVISILQIFGMNDVNIMVEKKFNNEFGVEFSDNLNEMENETKIKLNNEKNLYNKCIESTKNVSIALKNQEQAQNEYNKLPVYVEANNTKSNYGDINLFKSLKNDGNTVKNKIILNNQIKELQKVLNDKAEELLVVKLKEKKALKIITKIESIIKQLSTLQDTFTKYISKRDNLQAKEEKLYNKLKNEAYNANQEMKSFEHLNYLSKI